MKKHRLLRASMLQDLEKGKKCEIEAINGVILRYVQKAGMQAPYNANLIQVVKGIEEGKYKSSMDKWRYFKV